VLQRERWLGQRPDRQSQEHERIVIARAAVEVDLVTGQAAVY
jgi:hypothetical protein